jgi:hypothetical protein
MQVLQSRMPRFDSPISRRAIAAPNPPRQPNYVRRFRKLPEPDALKRRSKMLPERYSDKPVAHAALRISKPGFVPPAPPFYPDFEWRFPAGCGRFAAWGNLTPAHICRSILDAAPVEVHRVFGSRLRRHWRLIMWSRRRAADAGTMSAGSHLVRSMTPPGMKL